MLTDSRQKRMEAALTDFRDSDRWSPGINAIAKAALSHPYEGTGEEPCKCCGEKRNDMIHPFIVHGKADVNTRREQ